MLRYALVLGPLLLVLPGEARALEGLPTLLRCGEQEVEVGRRGEGIELLAELDRHRLEPVPAASGASFEKPGDPSTFLWSRGERATVALAGTTLPECVAEPFRASGNEPFWRLVLEEEALLLDRPGEPTVRAPRPPVERRDGRSLLLGTIDGRPFGVTIEPAPCRDTMTGMPHPARVALTLDGRTLEGCGGDPGTLLRAREWQVAGLDGAPLASMRGVSLAFGTGGRFAGQGPCNRLLGGYRLTGEALGLGPVASTMMACPEPILAAEQKLVRALEAVRGFEPAADGGLVLVTGSGGRIALEPRGP